MKCALFAAESFGGSRNQAQSVKTVVSTLIAQALEISESVSKVGGSSTLDFHRTAIYLPPLLEPGNLAGVVAEFEKPSVALVLFPNVNAGSKDRPENCLENSRPHYKVGVSRSSSLAMAMTLSSAGVIPKRAIASGG